MRDRVRARNQDLDEEQAASLAGRFSQEVVAELVDEGQVLYPGQ